MNLVPLWILPLAPVAAALIAGLLALTRRAERSAPLVTLAAVALSCAIALGHTPAPDTAAHISANWLTIPGGFRIDLGVRLDALAWIMVLVVCLVSFLVQLYSTGYMKNENGYARYFAYLSLFTASMLGLVVADNLFQLYACWELVGICSYLLIGFWWFKPSAANAAKKAFIVTRFGDMGFLIGILLLAGAAGSFQFTAVEATVTRIAHGGPVSLPLVSAQTFLALAPLLLFCGAVGKSAQFPLHVWLPDAMEGPTPVSALIHAATMVAAGVYMVARLLPIFAASQLAMNIVIAIGAITALVAATIALVQYDIKKVLAYSTVSQLGYMMLALGAAGLWQGTFHLVTHAMFKALLFLGAGSVIHAMHGAEDPNDLRAMGGLGKRMRSTAITAGIGVLALSGIPGLSGFWSKDAILDAALENGQPVALFALAVAIVVAAITAFYSVRMWTLAFAGEARSEAAAHAHESPAVMTIPLWILAIPSVGLGWYLHSGGKFIHMLSGMAGVTEEARPPQLWLVALTSAGALAGVAAAWQLYSRPREGADPITRIPGYALFVNLWYVDAFWNMVGARGAIAVGRAIAWFDRNVIDAAVNAVGDLCQFGGRELRRTTNGQAQTYTAAFMAAAVAAVLVLAIQRGPVSTAHLAPGATGVTSGSRPTVDAPRLKYHPGGLAQGRARTAVATETSWRGALASARGDR